MKWSRIGGQRLPFLRLLSEHPVQVHYFVAHKTKQPASHADRQRFKVLEAALSSLFPLALEDMPLVLLDERHDRQNRREAVVLRSLGAKWRSVVPPYAYLPSDRVVGLQLVDVVAGALRAFESRGDTAWEAIRVVTRRIEI